MKLLSKPRNRFLLPSSTESFAFHACQGHECHSLCSVTGLWDLSYLLEMVIVYSFVATDACRVKVVPHCALRSCLSCVSQWTITAILVSKAAAAAEWCGVERSSRQDFSLKK